MKHIWNAGIVSLLILFFTGCNGKAELYEVSETGQKVYFQYEYINHAWGYQHYGWLVDSSGNVHCYDKPEDWILTDSLRQISGTDLNRNLLSADSVCYTLDEEVLESKIKLIEAASRGKISEPVHEMYDAGVGIYWAFIYNSKDDVYKKILLKQAGDFRIDNSSPEARTLYEWLESVNSSIRANK